MANGIQLDYKLKKGCSSRFNQKMFGRITTRRTKNGEYSYYIPGVLNRTPYHRIFEGRIFIGTTGEVDFDPIMQYCDMFKTSTTQKDDDEVLLKTGKQYWQFHAKERGLRVEWYKKA